MRKHPCAQLELVSTVCDTAEAKDAMVSMVKKAKELPLEVYAPETARVEQAANQADALVDVYYYSLNAAAKHGMNLSSVFQMVHTANMNKRDPVTQQFLKRADGKIIKPKGWVAPNVFAEISRQVKEASVLSYFPSACVLLLPVREISHWRQQRHTPQGAFASDAPDKENVHE